MKYNPPNYNRDFKDKLAIVTGAASGIGKATIEGLCYHGAIGIILDNDQEKGSKLEAKLRKKGYNVEFFKKDVSKLSEVQFAMWRLNEEYKQAPFFLVNNAGIEDNDTGNLVTMPEDISKKILHVSLKGYLNMIKAVVPLMIKGGGGRIVNTGSVQGEQSCKPGTIYQVIKAGIPAIARNLTIEYSRDYNIRANTILPGAIKTEGMGNARGSKEDIDNLRSVIPLGRRGHAQEVANATLFLLSEQARYIHGTTLAIDGGLPIHFQPGSFGIPKKYSKDDPDKEDFQK